MIELHLQLLDIVLSLRNKELPSVKKRSVKNSNMHTKCKCVKILSIVYMYVPAVSLVVWHIPGQKSSPKHLVEGPLLIECKAQ